MNRSIVDCAATILQLSSDSVVPSLARIYYSFPVFHVHPCDRSARIDRVAHGADSRCMPFMTIVTVTRASPFPLPFSCGALLSRDSDYILATSCVSTLSRCMHTARRFTGCKAKSNAKQFRLDNRDNNNVTK